MKKESWARLIALNMPDTPEEGDIRGRIFENSFKCDTDGLHVLQVGQLIEGFLLVLNNIYKVLNTHASGILEAM